MTPKNTPALLLLAVAMSACGPATVGDLDEGSAGLTPSANAIVLPAAAGPGGQPLGPAPVLLDAVAVRITENANNFIERQASNRDIAYQSVRIEKPNMSCFDKIGINNFDLQSHIDLADLDWQATPDGLSVVAYIDHLDVKGQIFGEDSDTFDLCPSFTSTINLIRLTGIVFTANLRPSADNAYNIYVNFNQPPQMQVDGLAIDVGFLPSFVEDFVFGLEFVQDFLFAKINGVLSEKVPELTRDALFTAMFTGTAGPGFDYAIGASDIAIDAEGATARFDIQVDYDGVANACLPAAPMPDFTIRGTNGLGTYGDASMAELSIADAAVNEVMWAAWKSGMLCYDSETHPMEAFEHVLEGLNPAAGEMLKYKLVVAEPPRVMFREGKIEATMKQFFMEATSIGVDGTEKVLLRMKADMKMGMTMDLDRNTNRVLMSLDGTSLEFDTIESEILFAEDRDVEDHLKQFVRGFVIPRLNAKMQSMPVTNTLFAVADYIVLLDGMHLREGHAVVGATLYGKNDPEVDRIAPDTSIVGQPGLLDTTHTTISYSGTDDRAGDLVYAWQVDGTGWSTWSDKTEAALSALTDGPHIFEVKSRDRWMNEDPTPDSVQMSVAAVKEAPAAGCGCDLSQSSSSPTPAGAIASLLAAVGLGLTIRRRRTI